MGQERDPGAKQGSCEQARLLSSPEHPGQDKDRPRASDSGVSRTVRGSWRNTQNSRAGEQTDRKMRKWSKTDFDGGREIAGEATHTLTLTHSLFLTHTLTHSHARVCAHAASLSCAGNNPALDAGPQLHRRCRAVTLHICQLRMQRLSQGGVCECESVCACLFLPEKSEVSAGQKEPPGAWGLSRESTPQKQGLLLPVLHRERPGAAQR